MAVYPVKPYDTVVKRIVTHSPTVKSFFLHFQHGEAMPFLAGQFVMAKAPRDGQLVKKPYSIASAPFAVTDGGYIELCIKKVEGGFMSTYFHHLQEGAILPIEGPYGKFMMKHATGPEPIIFVATGTGIAPLRSIWQEMFRAGTTKDLWCILGVRYEEEILYREESEALARAHPNFHFIPTVSRPGPNWKGEVGYVQDKLLKYFPTPKGFIYACGLVDMIQGLKEKSLAHGYTKEQLHYEIWT